MQHTYKFAHNRGNKRVWLEGSRLLDTGIRHRMPFTQTVSDDNITFDFAPADDGGRLRHVAGTPDRPIIDSCSAMITAFAKSATHYTATFDNTGNAPLITITRAS